MLPIKLFDLNYNYSYGNRVAPESSNSELLSRNLTFGNITENIMNRKRCSKCGELKSLDNFHKNKSKPDGHRYICKTCVREKDYQRYINNLSPEELIRYNISKKRKKLFKNGKSICSECGKIKPLNEFHKRKVSPNGHKNKCKTCANKEKHQTYINNLNSEQLIKYNRNKKRKKLLKEGKSICSECGKVKPLENFHNRITSLDEHSYKCKTCRNRKVHQNYINSLSPEELKIYKQKEERKNLNNKLLKKGQYNCARCGKTKSLSEFHKDSRSSHGYAYVCRSCKNKQNQKYRNKMKQDPKWVEHRNKQAKKIYYKNIEYYRKQKRKRWGNKKDDPRFRLNHSIGVGICHSLKGNKNGRHWEDLVGYTLNELKKHLEKQFTNKMTWDNQGSYWHIDHIIPISAFNFSKPEHIGFKKCWALKNLQPLEAKENLRKSNKLIKDKQEYLTL